MTKEKVKGFFRSRYHMGLVGLYAIWWVVMAFNPFDRGDWFLENILVLATVVVFWRYYPRLPLSNASLTLIAIFLGFHTLGSHYTYAEVPLGYWLQEILNLDRNHYDRVIHFSFGLLMFWPLKEVASFGMGTKKPWDDFIGLLFIISMSALYESVEWVVAAFLYPDSGLAIAFLGTQGDLFDAQKDHTLAITGGIISFFIARILGRMNKLPKPS